MTKKAVSPDHASSDQPDVGKTYEDVMANISDFTPEQWAWIRAQTLENEKNYVPTSSLMEGL